MCATHKYRPHGTHEGGPDDPPECPVCYGANEVDGKLCICQRDPQDDIDAMVDDAIERKRLGE